MIVKISGEQELYELAAQLLHIMANLRFYEMKLKEAGGGFELRNRVKDWQKRADDLIERYSVERTTLVQQVKIEKQS